jgi:hypothetical protein
VVLRIEFRAMHVLVKHSALSYIPSSLFGFSMNNIHKYEREEEVEDGENEAILKGHKGSGGRVQKDHSSSPAQTKKKKVSEILNKPCMVMETCGKKHEALSEK